MWYRRPYRDMADTSCRTSGFGAYAGLEPVKLKSKKRGDSLDFLAPPSVTIPTSFLPEIMDFSKFRDTGELSDISVVVEGTEFKLHKFPLYIKSDFFRALARSARGDKDRVELSEFPGGAETFRDVANYCYNVKVSITRDNVCKLRCAAEFLQMNSPGNLAGLADRFLQDTLTSAKLGHKFETIADLVLQCCELGAIAEQANVVDKCLNAIVDCWLISTKFSRRYTSDIRLPSEIEGIRKLCQFPLSWYKQLVISAREKSVRPAVLATLAQTYISDAVDRKYGKKKETKGEVPPQPEPAAAEEVINEDEQPQDKPDGKSSSSSSSSESESEHGSEHGSGGKEEGQDGEEEPRVQEVDEQKEDDQGEREEPANVEADLDIGEIMDAILLEIPTDNQLLNESFSHKWVAEMLKIAAEVGCESREVLQKLSGKMLHRFSKEDLSELSAETLSEIVAEGCRDSQTDPDDVCRVLDDYLMDQADKEQLTVDTFQTLVDAVPKDSRASHDMLFQVLETLLQSERIPVDEEKKQELLKTVDYSRLSESTLQRAYDSGLVPGEYVTRAALALCVKLRNDLDTAKVIIRDQEQRMERFGLTPGAGSTWLKSMETGSAAKRRQQTLTADGAEYEPSYESSLARASMRSAATPTLASDMELKMALDSLNRNYDRQVESIGLTDAAPTPSTGGKTSNYSSYYGEEGSSSDTYRQEPYTSSYTWSRSYKYPKS